MKRGSLLSRTEMKNVYGGKVAPGGGGICENWSNKSYDICLNCCMSWSSTQPNPPSDPTGVGYCDMICSRNAVSS